MKQLIRTYLAALRERGELDVVLPDLLSQMGLNVISRPCRGTRQAGVDVAAVGAIDGGPEKLYLFAIKAGDLTRSAWHVGEQALKPSLDEILGPYRRNRIPDEHTGKPIVICITIGGEIREVVSEDLRAFEDKHTDVTFERWNGDKLAELTLKYLFREELVPADLRTRLRKALAMVDEAEACFRYFSRLIRSLSEIAEPNEKQRITAIRQMSVCLWILFAWSRDANNLEAAYRSAEWTVLHAWEVLHPLIDKSKPHDTAAEAFQSVFLAYEQIAGQFLEENVVPFADKLHALSVAVASPEPTDVNLKLFDLVGRVGLRGLWWFWLTGVLGEQTTAVEQCKHQAQRCAALVVSMITHNPQLLLPVADDQAIDIWIAIALLAIAPDTRPSVLNWLSEILQRARIAFQMHGKYPCIFHAYAELLDHPTRDDAYRKEATAGSILYPMIALWAALYHDDALYGRVAAFKAENLAHCTFQFWYPDELSEQNFYTNRAMHGAVLSDVAIEKSPAEYLNQIFGECESSPFYDNLSAVGAGWWPLILMACRVHRVPPPVHLFRSLRTSTIPTSTPKMTVTD
jgi:hypothetical protein